MAKVQRQLLAPWIRERMKLRRVCTFAICFAVLLITTTPVAVEGLPIRGPDFSTCNAVTPRPTAGINHTIDCCMIDTGKPIKEFEFNSDLPVRVRRPAHKLDEEYIRKYERAMGLMRALPPEDPRSHIAQANIHCAYCSKVYNYVNSTLAEPYNVHHSWLFLPFHRWYGYFHERILAKLIGDDTFALPYWAWDVQLEDNQPANVMPDAYLRKNSSLFNRNRSPTHQPPRRADLDHRSLDNKTDDELLDFNKFVMWRMMVGDAKTSEAFFGEKYAQGDPKYAGDAILEATAHTAIHRWVGDEGKDWMDLAPAWSAGREPMFFAHHAQMDRLWMMWNKWGGKDLTHPDWLDAQYVFYDENGDLVRVTVRDCLSMEKLRISYEEVEPDWIDYKPRSIRDADPKYVKAGFVRRILRQVLAGEAYTNIANALVSYLQPEKHSAQVAFGGGNRAAMTSRLFMPEVITSSSDASFVYDEVLVIDGVVEMPFDVDVHFNIFLQLPEAEERTPRNFVEFLCTVTIDSSEDNRIHPTDVRRFRRTVGIGERLQILDGVRQKSISITFVPTWDQKHDPDVSVRVTDLTLERKLVR